MVEFPPQDRPNVDKGDITHWSISRRQLLAFAPGLLAVACAVAPQTTESTPGVPQLDRGRLYKADFERVIKEFIGVRYQQYGLITDAQMRGIDDENYWAGARYQDGIIEFVNTGPSLQRPLFPEQSFLVSNRYDSKGNLRESFLATGRIAGPEYNINTLPLIEMGVLPALTPNSEGMAEEGFSHIPLDKLKEVVGIVFNLPANTRFEDARVCYSFPMGRDIISTPGLIGRAELGDGRRLLIRAHAGADADLWVTAPGDRQPDIHSCSWFDQQKMRVRLEWWDFKFRMAVRINRLLH